MKKETSRERTKQQKAEIESLAALPDERIDTSDIPEIPDWSGARRGTLYRPVKQQITLRLDAGRGGVVQVQRPWWTGVPD